MAYIIKAYNKYNRWDREHALHIFSVNERMYAIMEVGMEWGLPQVPGSLEYEEDLGMYRVYDTEE